MIKRFRDTDYFVSDDGKVFSAKRGRFRELSQAKGNVYKQVLLSVGNTYLPIKVHVMVAETFLGPKPSPNHQVRHLDGTRDNNDVSNLAWGTAGDNARDAQRHGTRPIKQPRVRKQLTPDQVLVMKSLLARGMLSQRKIAEKFGVTESLVSHVKAGRRWNSVSAPCNSAADLI